jgi:hypothetical protein
MYGNSIVEPRVKTGPSSFRTLREARADRHSGPPHVFVRAGEVTSFVPRDAFENVQEEVLAIRKRAELIAASRR